MYVRDFMTKEVVTVPPDMLLRDAEQLMKEKKIRRLPVVEGGKLLGIVTETRMREVAPSPANSLSVWELSYILARMKVSDAMTTNVVTVTPDTTIGDAAVLGYRHSVGALPVVENGKLVGILTQTDTFRVLIEVLGTRETGVCLRIHQHEALKAETIAEIVAVIGKRGHIIRSLFQVKAPGRPHADIVVRLDAPNADAAVEELSKMGYKVEVT